MRNLRRRPSRLLGSLCNPKGAIDLASIMVGVLIIGIVGSAIGATVSAVIPWSHNEAAKAELDAVHTAQSVAYVHGGTYLTVPELVAAGWLEAGTPQVAAPAAPRSFGMSVGSPALSTVSEKRSGSVVVAAVGLEGRCFVAAVKSEAGPVYYITSADSSAVEAPISEAVPDTSWCAEFPAVALFATPGVETISSGAHQSIVIGKDGDLYWWGENMNNQMGTGIQRNNVPQALTPAPSNGFTKVDVGKYHALALDGTGNVWALGGPEHGRVGDRTYAEIAAGNSFSIAIDTTGHLWAWGNNSEGQLGDGTLTSRTEPVAITPSRTYSKVAVGERTTLALDTTGHLWAWGRNGSGQLGDGTTTLRKIPTAITPSRTYKSIDTTVSHSVAVETNGNLWAWGSNATGQLGLGHTTGQKVPVQVTPGKTYTAVSAEYQHTLALDSDGHAWSWGWNGYGQLGTGDKINRTRPFALLGDREFVQVETGTEHSTALDADGNVWTWGKNDYGQLGDGSAMGTIASRLVPKMIEIG